MNRYGMKAIIGAVAGAMTMATVAGAADVAVGVDVNTPNVRVQVGAPPPPPLAPRTVVVERERVITHERGERHDWGKHKGHYKKHYKKHEHKDKHHRD
ncbi:hypothetical protein F6V30_06165 [Oryzomonas sagensis]|uniref:Uncharacterized protein n=1 Tax=Oryzomonas sagensis TaxID=2603857 RepID=A0ABQ6TTP8_9BACT|nr:hypothetical protein [Oryzomonas sagensis]KAB0672149.1 hypothetical protein F6V30_06165 [Oryzomonas sagensis]